MSLLCRLFGHPFARMVFLFAYGPGEHASFVQIHCDRCGRVNKWHRIPSRTQSGVDRELNRPLPPPGDNG